MKTITIIILIIFSQTGFAKGQYGPIVISEVTSIYDADTFRVNINEWPDIVGHHIPIRVLGIDAPEIRGEMPGWTSGGIMMVEAEKHGANKTRIKSMCYAHNRDYVK